MKYCVTILVGLAALLMPQIEAGAEGRLNTISRSLIRTNQNLVSYENILKNNQTTREKLRDLSRSTLLQYLSDATKDVEAEAKRINKIPCATLVKPELKSTVHSLLNIAAVTKCIEENMPNWKTITNEIDSLIAEGNRMEANIAVEKKKCIFNSNPDSCLEPVRSQFDSYADKHRKSDLNIQAKIEKIYKQKAADVLQCLGFKRALETLKIKVLKCLSQ